MSAIRTRAQAIRLWATPTKIIATTLLIVSALSFWAATQVQHLNDTPTPITTRPACGVTREWVAPAIPGIPGYCKDLPR